MDPAVHKACGGPVRMRIVLTDQQLLDSHAFAAYVGFVPGDRALGHPCCIGWCDHCEVALAVTDVEGSLIDALTAADWQHLLELAQRSNTTIAH